jgi:signal transduction histidine kinase
MLLAVSLTMLFSVAWGGWTWTREKNLLHDKLDRQGELLVSSMAIPIINALLYEELGIIEEGGLLDNFVTDIMANKNLHPVYAMVLDTDGRVLAHNRLTEYGEIYRDPTTLAALGSTEVQKNRIAVDGQPVLDFAAPLSISGKRWGCLRVGVSLDPLRRELNMLGGNILVFSISFAIVAMFVFFLAGQKLASPIVSLTRTMETMDSDDPTYFPDTVRHDEIGRLQRSFHDMLKRLQQSEQEKRQSLEKVAENERLAIVGKLVSGIAHEVNNPLSGIEGAMYHIRENSSGEVSQYVKAAEQGVERIGRLIGQLLDLSRADVMEAESVDSAEFFEEIALFAKMALKDKSCRLLTKDLCPQQVVCLDRDRIHQAVLNLVLNAADAVAGDDGYVRLEAFYREDSYGFRVIDNGQGIPYDIQKMIFEPFFSTKGAGKGTGMGLAISRTIAERLGGRLECQSSEGQGTVFTLWLPQKHQNAEV